MTYEPLPKTFAILTQIHQCLVNGFSPTIAVNVVLLQWFSLMDYKVNGTVNGCKKYQTIEFT